jgi:hypothetical protein
MQTSSLAHAKVFCFGLGYSAEMFARCVRSRGMEVAGTARDEARGRRLAREGFAMWPWTGERPLPDEALAGATHVLVSVPPDAEGDPVLRTHAAMLRRQRGLQWIGYLSSVGVYGDHGGGWVDETTPAVPVTRRGQYRLAAEQAWLALHASDGLPVHIFRLAGIYGPERNALREMLEGKARRIFKVGQVFSRIHVEDIAGTLETSLARPHPGAIYAVADALPAPAHEVVAYAAALLDLPPPPLMPYAWAELSPMARSFYQASRRVCNRRILEELGVALRYPDYRAGLEALLACEQQAWEGRRTREQNA